MSGVPIPGVEGTIVDTGDEVALGIDLGTTSVKVVVLDADGAVIATAASHHGIIESAYGVEADPDAWWESLLRALALLPIDLGTVSCIGFSGNMSSVVLVDRVLEPVRPAILLADSRGRDELAGLDDETVATIVRQTGNIPETVFSLSTLLWLKSTEPHALSAASAWLSAKDYLRGRLTGESATDHTDAFNSLLTHGADWDRSTIDAIGLPLRLFPPLLSSGDVAGRVTAAAAAATGLPVGIPVATGAGDVAAGIAGAGGLEPASLSISLGTSATVEAAVDELRLPSDALGRLTVHPTADGGLFALGSLLTGGLALNWIRSLAGGEALVGIPSEPQSGEGVVFLPYLSGTGSPDFVSEARGTLFGLTPASSGTDLTRALMEAVAFDIADLVDMLGAHAYARVRVSGGGSRLAAWPQVLADVLGLPVSTLDVPDLSAIGAAVLGWRAVGRSVVVADHSGVVLPRPEFAMTWARRRATAARARRTALDFYTTPPTAGDIS